MHDQTPLQRIHRLFRTWARDPAAKDAIFLLVHPGHVKTEMGEAGGRKVRLGVGDSVC